MRSINASIFSSSSDGRLSIKVAFSAVDKVKSIFVPWAISKIYDPLYAEPGKLLSSKHSNFLKKMLHARISICLPASFT